MWHIGEFAQRLRVTARAVRHYEEIGLLLPQSVDPASGYRRYGASQLMRGLQIEQLKAAGLALDDIRQVLDDPSVAMRTLSVQRRQVGARIAEARRHLATLDVLLAARAGIAPPQIVETAACDALMMSITASVDELSREIRRAMQQLGRVARGHGTRCVTYSARLPLDLDEAVAVVVLGHLEGPIPGSVVQPAERCLAATWTGPIEMLPLVYDLVLETARVRDIATADVAVEHYLDLAAIGTTVVRVPLAS